MRINLEKKTNVNKKKRAYSILLLGLRYILTITMEREKKPWINVAFFHLYSNLKSKNT